MQILWYCGMPYAYSRLCRVSSFTTNISAELSSHINANWNNNIPGDNMTINFHEADPRYVPMSSPAFNTVTTLYLPLFYQSHPSDP